MLRNWVSIFINKFFCRLPLSCWFTCCQLFRIVKNHERNIEAHREWWETLIVTSLIVRGLIESSELTTLILVLISIADCSLSVAELKTAIIYPNQQIFPETKSVRNCTSWQPISFSFSAFNKEENFGWFQQKSFIFHAQFCFKPQQIR